MKTDLTCGIKRRKREYVLDDVPPPARRKIENAFARSGGSKIKMHITLIVSETQNEPESQEVPKGTRADCPFCGGDVSVKKDSKLRQHKNGDNICKGTDRYVKPEEWN